MTEYTVFSNTHKIFTKIIYVGPYTASPNKFKRTEIIQCMFSDPNKIKYRINNKEENHQILGNYIFLNNPWVTFSQGKFENSLN